MIIVGQWKEDGEPTTSRRAWTNDAASSRFHSNRSRFLPRFNGSRYHQLIFCLYSLKLSFIRSEDDLIIVTVTQEYGIIDFINKKHGGSLADDRVHRLASENQ